MIPVDDFVMESKIRRYEIWSDGQIQPQYYIKYYGKGWLRRLLDSDTRDDYCFSFEKAYSIVKACIANDDQKPTPKHKRIL